MSDVPWGTGVSSCSSRRLGSNDSITQRFLDDCSVERNTIWLAELLLDATIRICSEIKQINARNGLFWPQRVKNKPELRQCFGEMTDSIRKRWPYRRGLPFKDSSWGRMTNVFLEKRDESLEHQLCILFTWLLASTYRWRRGFRILYPLHTLIRLFLGSGQRLCS